MTADSPEPQTSANESPTPAADSADAPVTTPEAAAGNPPSFGWNSYAERINGRFAMIGFVALLLIELLTRQDFFTWLGF